MTLGLAVYAALVATLTLLLEYGRSWWRERRPLRVSYSAGVTALYVQTSDAEGNAIANRVSDVAMVYLSCVNLSDIPLRVMEVGFGKQSLWDRLRRKPRRFSILPWPIVSGELPHNLEPRRSWATGFRWDEAKFDVTENMRAYVRLDDGRRGYSKRQRLTKPSTSDAAKQ